MNLATMQINRLKSHDYHILMERLLPVMVRGYVPDHIWQVLAELTFFFCQLCAKELSIVVIEEMERMAPVLLCKLEKTFPPGFFNPMEHMILHLPYKTRMGGPAQPVGAIQWRDVKRFFELDVKINAKLKLLLQRHTFSRSCHTSHLNTMLTTFLACIIHPLVTMLGTMNQISVFFKGNWEVQVVRPSRPCNFKSGALSCYMC